MLDIHLALNPTTEQKLEKILNGITNSEEFAHILDELTKLFNKIDKLDRLNYLVSSWDIFCYSSA